MVAQNSELLSLDNLLISCSEDTQPARTRGRDSASVCAVSVSGKKTPCSNTGSNSQAIANVNTSVSSKGFGNWEPWQPGYEPWVDYLQGTGFCAWADMKIIMDIFKQQAYDSFVPKFGSGYYVGNRRYAHSHSSLLGIIINWERIDFNADIGYDENADINLDYELSSLSSDVCIRFHISIPGKPLNAIGAKNGIALLRLLSENYSFSCSRIDCKVRNYTWVVDFNKLQEVVDNKHVVSGLKTTYIQSESTKSNIDNDSDIDDKFSEQVGRTRIFGSPKSDKRITFYDAKPVHNVDAIDIEVRFRKKLAKSAFVAILGTEEQNFSVYESLRAVQNIVAGSIDFVKKIPGERNIQRCERYAFWQEFRDAVGGAMRVSKPKKVIDFIKQKQWLEEKCFRVIAMTQELMGAAYFHKWIEDICRRGRESFTPTQEAYIETYRKLGLHRVKFVPYRNDGYMQSMSAIVDE